MISVLRDVMIATALVVVGFACGALLRQLVGGGTLVYLFGLWVGLLPLWLFLGYREVSTANLADYCIWGLAILAMHFVVSSVDSLYMDELAGLAGVFIILLTFQSLKLLLRGVKSWWLRARKATRSTRR